MVNKYLKLPIITHVEFAMTPGTIVTLEGKVPYQSGDALMTGVSGERWPISRVRFDSTYEAVPPTMRGEDGGYIKKAIPVTAIQITETTLVTLTGEPAKITGQIGDWLITAPDGSQWVVSDAIFRQTYIPAE